MEQTDNYSKSKKSCIWIDVMMTTTDNDSRGEKWEEGDCHISLLWATLSLHQKYKQQSNYYVSTLSSQLILSRVKPI